MTVSRLPASTQTCLWRFSGPLTVVLDKPPSAEFRRDGQNSVRAVTAGHVPAMRAKLQPTGAFKKRGGTVSPDNSYT
jgi:hypothetical protein